MREVRNEAEGKQSDVMNMWSDAQHAWTDAFKQMTTMTQQILGGAGEPGEFGGPFDAWMKSYRQALDGLVKFPVGGSLGNTMEMFLSAANTFLNMHRSWLQTLKDTHGGGFGSDKMMTTEALKGWSEAVKTMFATMTNISLPEPVRAMLGPAGEFQQTMLRNFTKNIQGSMGGYQQFFIPWVEAFEGLTKGATGVMGGSGGPQALQQFQDTWTSAYHDTIGKFFNAPLVGPSRLTMEKAMRAVDAYLKFYGANIDFAFRVYEPGVQAFEQISKKAGELFKQDVTPDTFRDLYNLALQIYEETFHQMFKSESFVRGLHLVLDATLEFRRCNDEFVEVMLRETPVVTQSEMDEVYVELHQLKRTVRQLEVELRKKQG
jgi:hypothetical protein